MQRELELKFELSKSDVERLSGELPVGDLSVGPAETKKLRTVYFDTDSTRFGQRLEASGEVRGFADDRLLLGRTRADEVTDDHEAGRDPDPHLQRDASRGFELWHSVDEGKPGANRTFCIMFVGLRIARTSENYLEISKALRAMSNAWPTVVP
jgi:hypothetical protein